VAEKVRFLQELRLIGSSMHLPWVVNGDFNLVVGPTDKSNNRVNRRLMDKFRHAINSLALQVLHLEQRTKRTDHGETGPHHV
jgi:hypothetical protein